MTTCCIICVDESLAFHEEPAGGNLELEYWRELSKDQCMKKAHLKSFSYSKLDDFSLECLRRRKLSKFWVVWGTIPSKILWTFQIGTGRPKYVSPTEKKPSSLTYAHRQESQLSSRTRILNACQISQNHADPYGMSSDRDCSISRWINKKRAFEGCMSESSTFGPVRCYFRILRFH